MRDKKGNTNKRSLAAKKEVLYRYNRIYLSEWLWEKYFKNQIEFMVSKYIASIWSDIMEIFVFPNIFFQWLRIVFCLR